MRLRATESCHQPAFWSALALALLVHVIVFSLVSLDFTPPSQRSGMDVVLLPSEPANHALKEDSSDPAADFLSNRSQSAGTQESTMPPSAADASAQMNEASSAEATAQADPSPQPEQDNHSALARALDLTGFAQRPDPSNWTRPATTIQSDPKHKFIHASTREHAYAAYMDAWVRKIERVGQLHYPQLARRQGLSGDLVLSVELLSSGEVADIRIDRPSGHALLDQAALDIVSLAAPYAPLPNTEEEIERLTITRTWQFSSGGTFR